MGDFFNVSFLAILQGVAEFLPISSSGHLVIGQHLLDVKDAGLQLDVFLHAGTLISVAVYFRKSLWRILAERDFRYVAMIICSALPAVLVYVVFRENIESLFSNAKMVGALLMFTGAILAGTRFLPTGEKDVSFIRALWMGVMQAIALLPGVSRSGMTLAAARSGRVDPSRSAEFSFLMSAPLILGGMLLEIMKMFSAGDGSGQEGLGIGLLIWGALLAAMVGYFSLVALVKMLKGRWFWLFGPYCIVVGMLTLCLID
ncbi:MAG: undecaprenyl-diphosphate phosphatase [Kiritimatiellae bacterium]|nr:undecaprenyl-diphosphate phosphatase [Kiritimatiellia bacterium]